MSEKTKYFQHQFKLSDTQLKSVISAIQSKEPIVLKLNKNNFNDGNKDGVAITLPLTKTDAKKVIENKSFDYQLNKSKLALLKVGEEKEGGILPFLPFILPAIGAIAGLGTMGATVAKTVIEKNAKDKELAEQERHNKAMETKGSAITLRPWKNGSSVGVKDFINKSKLDDIGKRTFRSFLKNLNDNVEISYDGSALTLRNIL